jgi:tetraacyldisaccharide 4'-kinase
MKSPEFWRSDVKSAWPYVLSPLSWIYSKADAINRSMITPEKADVPVICVGNIVAGGAGKTPVALAIARLFQVEGKQPHFLTRGYGGKLEGPVRVVLVVHSFEDVGDESLLLAEVAPTWVAKDRQAGAGAAISAGADVIIMDDGFQNPGLYKDISLLVIDAEYGIGNGRILPAGPLRESFSSGIDRADALVLVGQHTGMSEINHSNINKPVYSAMILPRQAGDVLSGENVVAFAGIGRPEKFFNSLAFAGCNLIDCISFADHHVYKQQEIMKMVELSAANGAALVTTRKDFVRLPSEAKLMVTVFDIDLHFEDPEPLRRFLLTSLDEKAKQNG